MAKPRTIHEIVDQAANEDALYHIGMKQGFQESAALEMAKEWKGYFNVDKVASDGTGMNAWVESYAKQRPHVMIHQATDYDSMAMQMTAFLGDAGKRSLTDLGKVRNHLGSDEALAAAAGVFGISNPYNLREVGVAPANIGKLIDSDKALREATELEARAAALRKAADLAAPRTNGSDGASNPWSAKGWSLQKQGSLVKAIGAEKAARIASAMGCVLGSVRANPAYNK